MISHIKIGLLSFLILSVFACRKASGKAPVKDTTENNTPPGDLVPPVVHFPTPSYNPSALDTTRAFVTTPLVNNLQRTDLLEISGIAASRVNPGVLYIHNDSGNPSLVYLIDRTGAAKGTLNIPAGNRDWEDIAVGPGPVAGKNYVYLGDIGDNNTMHSTVFVYRFEEPDLAGPTLPVPINIARIDTIQLKYPDGPINAETLMVDPATKDIYIASKQSNLSKIYVAPYPQSTTSATTLTPVVQLYFNKATGGDISPDGTEILLRSNKLIWYWKLPAGTSISQGLTMQPKKTPKTNKKPKNKGIGFAADGSGYYTDTEIKGYPGKLATISFNKRK